MTEKWKAFPLSPYTPSKGQLRWARMMFRPPSLRPTKQPNAGMDRQVNTQRRTGTDPPRSEAVAAGWAYAKGGGGGRRDRSIEPSVSSFGWSNITIIGAANTATLVICTIASLMERIFLFRRVYLKFRRVDDAYIDDDSSFLLRIRIVSNVIVMDWLGHFFIVSAY